MNIVLDNLSVEFEGVDILKNISFEVSSGDICAIVGASGCGKSTLLRVVAGIVSQYGGLVSLDGKSPNPVKQRIAFVPQSYGLLPWKTVKQNIVLGAKIHKEPFDIELYKEILGRLKLYDLQNRFPQELSGGQRQRVALARAFLQHPHILLLDEPFSALDAVTAKDSRQLFRDIWNQHKVTTLLVTHSLDDAIELGSKVVVIGGTPGTVLKQCVQLVGRGCLQRFMESIN